MLTLRWQLEPDSGQWHTLRTSTALTDRPVFIHLGLISAPLAPTMQRLVDRLCQLLEQMGSPVGGPAGLETWQEVTGEVYRLEVILGDGVTPIPPLPRLVEATRSPLDTVWALPILPAEPPDAADRTLPEELRCQHTAFWQGHAIEELALTVLARAGISSLDRRVFISYRRSDTQPMANQLFEALTRLNYDVYLDTVSNDPGLDFQAQLFAHLVDKSMVVLLHSATFHQSVWAMAELDFAIRNDLNPLILRLPAVSGDLPGQRAGDLLNLEEQDLLPQQQGVARAFTGPGLERVLQRIHAVHDVQLVGRVVSLRQRTLRILTERGLHPSLSPHDTGIHLCDGAGLARFSLVPSSRPPGLPELHRASVRSGAAYGQQRIVVGRTAAMPEARRRQLDWVVANRNVEYQDVADLPGLCDRLAEQLA